jgi:hypothetical protein
MGDKCGGIKNLMSAGQTQDSKAKRTPAVKIGGRGAPRRPMPKKKAVSEEKKEVNLPAALASSKYRSVRIEKVSNCCFVGKDGTMVSHNAPKVCAIFHKNKLPVGYIVTGEGELTEGGRTPTFDLDVVKKVLAEKNIDIEDLAKKVEAGDKSALEKIIEKLKDVDFSGEERKEDAEIVEISEDSAEEKDK